MLEEYTYVFAIGTMFALLEAYNNGANDVANAWATSVSSRSISYRWAMLCCLVFELTGALTVGARTASTIKGGIIDVTAFQGNAGVQLLAFACAAAGASMWVMWCTRHSAHVSSTYSLVSAIAGVGVATVGVNGVQWGWNEGQGLGAIFAGLGMAPFIAGCFGAIIFMLVKVTVHMRQNPVPWAVWTSPFFFLIAATICTLSVVYKGSPKLGLAEKPTWYIVSVTLGTGFGVAALSAIFFVPYVHAKVVKKDNTLRWYDIFKGPANFSRPAPAEGAVAKVPNYNVVHHDEVEEDEREQAEQGIIETEHDPKKTSVTASSDDNASAEKNGLRRRQIDPEANLPLSQNSQDDYKILLAKATERHHAELRKRRGPLGWAMRYCHHHQRGAGSIYEWHNLKVVIQRIPAQIVVAALYGANYDIHKAQVGVLGTPEGKRMDRVYSHATKYPNEVEHLYSFVQIITACTASFAHGANDVGNSVGVWSAMYEAWSTGEPTDKKVPVKTWQIAVMALTICFGFITYGYNIMKVMGNKITYHSPSRGSSMEMGAAITTLIFSQYKLPVSTSMCITGATVGVGLCNGSFRAVNWQRVGLLMFSWIMTIPIAALIAGCLMALLLNAPHF